MRRLTKLFLLTIIVGPALAKAQDSTAKAVRDSTAKPVADSAAKPALPADAISTMTGVFTDEQAGKGATIYQSTCLACHDASDHTGATFKQNWDARTAFELFETIRTTMPNDNPGALPREDYASIVAYMFKQNNMPSGKKPLPSDSTGLAPIVIVVGDSAKRPAP
jgi:cytochrome c5